MMKHHALFAILSFAFVLSAEEIEIAPDASAWRVVGGSVEAVTLNGEPVLKITGPAALESVASYPVEQPLHCRMRGEFKADGNIHRFGVRCFVEDGNIVPEKMFKADKSAKTLRRPCRAEDCDLYVSDVNGFRRQYGLELIVGEYWIDAKIGRFFEEKDGGVITLYSPIGYTLPAGTPVRIGYRSRADIYFGGVLRGLGVWRSFDCDTMKGMHNMDYHQRRLHPDTKQVRLLIKANENGSADSVMYLRKLCFTATEK